MPRETESVVQVLEARGFIAQTSHPGLSEIARARALTLYCGFDPTANSLHLGHMVPIMALTHFQRHGHRVLVVVGGATGMVGDPSGRSSERQLLGPEDVKQNALALKAQLSRFLAFEGENAALMLDNNDWIGGISFVDWLRDVGKHFTVGYMLAKESVKRRLESDHGMSFTEFSYMTMQAFDFLHLFDAQGCELQVGGSDQWGNITAGFDLIHKVRGKSAFGLTFPLISTTRGEKFGKSAGNAVWLDPRRTSPFKFYQYWLQVDDADVERFLKLFTFCPLPDIAETCARHRQRPEDRIAQRLLASEMTRLVHGTDGLASAERATAALFGGAVQDLSSHELLDVFSEVPTGTFPGKELASGVSIADFLVRAGVAASKAGARRLLEQGALNLNGTRVTDSTQRVTTTDLLAGGFILIRTGKRRHFLVSTARTPRTRLLHIRCHQ